MIENDKIKISVIIPVYNAEKYLEKCIGSVISQDYTNWEIIAIDDGSKDNSWKILCCYANDDKRIIVETKENEGPGVTRNKCMEKASGDVIVFIDADDYIEPIYFSLLVEKIKNENADVVFIDVIQESPEGKIIKHERMSSFSTLDKKTLIGCQMTGYLPWGGVRKAALASIIKKNNLMYGKVSAGEESIFSFELLRHARNICFINRSLYHYINRVNSQSKKTSESPTLENMRKHLVDNGLFEEYEESLNALAFTKLIQWLLGYVYNHSVQETLKCFKNKVSSFKSEYSWDFRLKYLRKELRIIYPFVRCDFLTPIVLAAKIMF